MTEAEEIRAALKSEPGKIVKVEDLSKVIISNLHDTETRYPEQTRAFRELIEKMYALHLEKNSDYSPLNILGTGEIGSVVRLWDKTCRIMNLLGFRIEGRLVEYTSPKKPKNESVEDTLLDLANYAIIALILRQEKWGK